MSAAPMDRRGALRVLGAAALVAAGGNAAAAETGLAGVKARGSLTVAVYRDMPPFHDQGRGIDVDLAAALADALGIEADACGLVDHTRVGDEWEQSRGKVSIIDALIAQLAP